MVTNEMTIEKVKVVELTFEDGTKKLCRGGEDAVYRAWGTYPVVSARWTGEEETMFIKDPSGNVMEFKTMVNPDALFGEE